MSVLDPRELEASPLADLHTLAGELGLEGYRRLRKDDLIKQIVEASGGTYPPDNGDDAGSDGGADDAPEPDEIEEPEAKPRRRAARTRKPAAEPVAKDEAAEEPEPEPVAKDEAAEEPEREPEPDEEEELRSGVLDVLPNGSGFIRAELYRQTREDVYVSPAQIRRCELRPGDQVEGPVRPPRRNERHPSLLRVATVNGHDAEAPADRPRFDDLPAEWPSERFAAPNSLTNTPYGKGSRVAIGGPPGAGATSLLRQAVKALRERHDDVELIVVLAGVRPEEVAEWREIGAEVAGGSFEGSVDEQAQVAELAVQRAKRTAEQGRDAVVVIDSLDALPPSIARRVFGAGRNVPGAGTLTLLASTGASAEPHRMATTHITLEPNDGGGEPRIAAASGTLRRDLLS
jgi:transcription termination factor Rho